MTNHAKKAARIAKDAIPANQAEVIAAAQVHATLALVEQQNIANRIALGVAVREERRIAGFDELSEWLTEGGGVSGYFTRGELERLGAA